MHAFLSIFFFVLAVLEFVIIIGTQPGWLVVSYFSKMFIFLVLSAYFYLKYKKNYTP